MPSALTYPGVYIEELPSGVRTIVGVATSIAAFVGRTERGPVDTATTVTSPGDFERTFGNPGANAPVAHAVRDFFLNGGTQAVVVRVFQKDDPKPAAATAHDGVTLTAISPGEWGDQLQYQFDVLNPPQTGNSFNLSIFLKGTDPEPQLVESYTALSSDDTDSRSARLVLEAESNFVRAKLATPAKPITAAGPTTFETAAADKNTTLAAARLIGSKATKTGIFALDNADLFNLLCIPPDNPGQNPTGDPLRNDTDATVYQAALNYCRDRRAFLIVDSPSGWQTDAGAMTPAFKNNPRAAKAALGLSGPAARNAAVYFPRVLQPDPAQDNREVAFAPCGIVAGLFAKTDATRGVWKAPAGVDAGVLGIRKLGVNLTDDENGLLNPVGINCLRNFRAAGNVVWGSRTLRGDDQTPDDYKYVPVRRLALFIEESLYRGTQWAVFEPNDEPLWAQLRVNIKAFMNDLFRQGAFAGSSPAQAYKVKCDSETTTPSDVNKGIVNVLIGFAPLKPAEFVVLKIQQLAGQLDS